MRLAVVRLLLLTALLAEAVRERAGPDTTLVALRATMLPGVALLLTFAFGRKVGEGGEVYGL